MPWLRGISFSTPTRTQFPPVLLSKLEGALGLRRQLSSFHDRLSEIPCVVKITQSQLHVGAMEENVRILERNTRVN